MLKPWSMEVMILKGNDEWEHNNSVARTPYAISGHFLGLASVSITFSYTHLFKNIKSFTPPGLFISKVYTSLFKFQKLILGYLKIILWVLRHFWFILPTCCQPLLILSVPSPLVALYSSLQCTKTLLAWIFTEHTSHYRWMRI